MIITNALKGTGKACDPANKDLYYAEKNKEGVLYWYKLDGTKEEPVSLEHINASWWQPYHPKGEIRPKEAGELWDIKGMKCFTVQSGSFELIDERSIAIIKDNVIHGQNGCTRVFPEPPDDSMEEIVIADKKR